MTANGAPAEGVVGPSAELPAGELTSWLAAMEAALRGDADADVPCGTCTACCTSSQFVHIGPEEVDALAHIPAPLLFRAPGLPDGHVLMGYDERGHCPMLRDGACSIYDHRPRTCRTYDCRVFAASGLDPETDDKPLIAERVRRWRFSASTAATPVRHAAVRAAAGFLQEHRRDLPDGVVPSTATHLAVLAVEIHGTFLQPVEGTDDVELVTPPVEAVADAVARRAGPGR